MQIMSEKESREFATYLPHIRRRRLEEQAGWKQRRTKGWEKALRAAAVLRGHGALRVVAFGSLVRTGRYDDRSDIDLAEEGIAADEFWRAFAEASRVAEDFELDVVDLACCEIALRNVILQEGVPL